MVALPLLRELPILRRLILHQLHVSEEQTFLAHGCEAVFEGNNLLSRLFFNLRLILLRSPHAPPFSFDMYQHRRLKVVH